MKNKLRSLAAKARWADKHKRDVLLKKMRSPKHRKKMSNIVKKDWEINRDNHLKGIQSEECSKKHSDSAKKKFSTKEYKAYRSKYMRESYKLNRKVSSFGNDIITTNKAGKITCVGDEIFIAQLLDSAHIITKFKKESVRVAYKYRGVHKTYFPDFYAKTIDGIKCLIEVKSNLDKLTSVERKKHRAVQAYCRKRGWKFIIIGFGVMDQSKGGNKK